MLMKQGMRWNLFAALGGGLAAILVVAWPLVFWSDLSPDEADLIADLVTSRIDMLVVFALFAAGLTALAIKTFFNQHILPVARMAEYLGIMADDPSRRMHLIGTDEIRRLQAGINAVAEARARLQEDVQTQIAQARASVEAEKNRLAALMSELAQSVVVCNLEGRILLYNNRARVLFNTVFAGDGVHAGAIGLGRSIYTLLDRNLVQHALDNLRRRQARGARHPHAVFVTTTRSGQFVRVHMAAVQTHDAQRQSQLTGVVLLFDNITRTFEADQRRDELIHSITEGARASLANIRSAVEMLSLPDLERPMHERFMGVISDEVQRMGQHFTRVSNQFANTLKSRWPLEEMLGVEILSALTQRVGERGSLTFVQDEVDEDLWLRVDSFTLLQALSYLVMRLHDEYDVREIRLRLAPAPEGDVAHLDLVWGGVAISTETVMGWEMDPMHLTGVENTPLSVRDVIERHDGAFWFEREKVRSRAFFRIQLHTLRRSEDLELDLAVDDDSRPEYYDFDLFNWSDSSRALDDRLLTELTYTVFDTETTGLEPSKGDEIIQIGATRIVNGRLLRHEAFDQLIDPQRPLPPQSTAIHGITSEMLAGKPPIARVLPVFHAFAHDTVLVAHNAAFDMRFLQMKEAQTGLVFDQPVLDTLLLSAVVHPQQESHSLDAIAERLGLPVENRHTALSDAVVTGEVFLRLIPLLAKQGIRTLREAREAAEKTWYARINY